jgi:hypothetical protein
LEVATYLINVAQKIDPPGHDPGTATECHVSSQAFCVSGPRYTLPPDDLASIFPPADACGNFGQQLPHVVLSKQGLPWERNIFDDDPAKTPQTPWMAVLLFVAGEEIDGKPALRSPADVEVNRTMTATLSARRFKDHKTEQPDVVWPDFAPNWYEEQVLDSTNCNVIDVSGTAFRLLTPSREDLRWLAHVRKVDPSAKDTAVLKISPRGTYSVIVGKRLPTARTDRPVRHIAHLVSLEGWQDYITGKKTLNGYARMISYRSWSFDCAPQLKEDFTHLMNGLLREPKELNRPVRFAIPVAQNQKPDGTFESDYAWRAIQQGFAPLRYQTRQGEQTFGWYRGPFSPDPAKKFVIPDESAAQGDWLFFDRASAAMIYDPRYGIFDLSYAVAWETGRLLALSNRAFGQSLLEWQRRGHATVDRVAERQIQLAIMRWNLPLGRRFAEAEMEPVTAGAAGAAHLRKQIRSGFLTDDFVASLVTDFSQLLQPPNERGALFHEQPFVPSFFDSAAWGQPQTIFRGMLSAPAARTLVQEEGAKGTETIVDFLADLYLLIGVPFETLVPHASMLPVESVRFFHIDSNWLDALLEGALGIGVESSRDLAYQKLMKDTIRAAVCKATRGKRPALVKEAGGALRSDNSSTVDPQKMTGMLLRSALVSGWRGLEVNGYRKIAPTKNDPAAPDIGEWIQPLRIERLDGPDGNILLCLWPEVPAVVTIDEPHEGVAFGFEDAPLDVPRPNANRYLYLRQMSAKDYGILYPKDSKKYIDVQPYMDDAQKLKISELRTRIQSDLGGTALNIRDFAVQMVRVPQQGVFAWHERAAAESEGSDA